jgi:hypothetical protein
MPLPYHVSSVMDRNKKELFSREIKKDPVGKIKKWSGSKGKRTYLRMIIHEISQA